MAPLILLIFAVGAGADAVAGEEERGALDLLLAHPLRRRRLRRPALPRAGGARRGADDPPARDRRARSRAVDLEIGLGSYSRPR